jgi:SAM-dependent methyltransferase
MPNSLPARELPGVDPRLALRSAPSRRQTRGAAIDHPVVPVASSRPRMSWQQRYMERFYDPRRGFRDGDYDFHRLCGEYIARGSRILEIGSGPANTTSDFLASIGELHGVDPDPDVKGNPALASSQVITNDRFPFADSHFDACVSNYVLEHVENPHTHLREIARVLRPGGTYLFRTPNRYHYVAIVSSLTPHWFHEAVANRLRNRDPNAHAPYPTVYALNTRGAIERRARENGFAVEALHMIEKEPSYGMSSRALFLAFTAYERVVNASPLGAPLRANIFGILRKL